MEERTIEIPAGRVTLEANWNIPDETDGFVVFAHGSGSSRHSPRNRFVAKILNEARLSTVLVDLLTSDEEAVDIQTAQLRFNIGLLAERLTQVTDWLFKQAYTHDAPFGYFGSSTGAAAALMAAAERPRIIGAVVSRGGRPDLAARALPYAQAPTLLIVGGNDVQVIGMNRDAIRQLRCETKLEIIPGASHLFEEPGALETVARLARQWFADHFAGVRSAGRSADL